MDDLYFYLTIIFYITIVFLSIQYIRFKQYLSKITSSNLQQSSFYQIQTRSAIENVGFQQPKILFMSSKYYQQNDLESLPYHISRQKYANIDIVKIPIKLSEIHLNLDFHNYTEILLSLENEFLFQFISRNKFIKDLQQLNHFFYSRGFTQKIKIITNFNNLPYGLPFPFNHYYHHNKTKILQILHNNHIQTTHISK